MKQLIKPLNCEENYYSHLLKYKRALRKQTVLVIFAMVNAMIFFSALGLQKIGTFFLGLKGFCRKKFLSALWFSTNEETYSVSIYMNQDKTNEISVCDSAWAQVFFYNCAKAFWNPPIYVLTLHDR